MAEKQDKLTNEAKHKAQVSREEVGGPDATEANSRLRDIGELLNPIPKNLKYCGSMSTHIYQSEMLGQVFFMSQVTTLADTPEETTSAAFSNLRGDAQEYFGRRRQRSRSGF